MMLIITASHNKEVFDKYLGQSRLAGHDLVVMKDYNNVAKAYNEAIKDRFLPEIIIFVHHDVILPISFFPKLNIILQSIRDKKWGCLGVAGASFANVPGEIKYEGNLIYQDKEWKNGETGKQNSLYEEVQTIDELILITNKTALEGTNFDEDLGNHFYGADICMQMEKRGYKNYVINNPVFHYGLTGYNEEFNIKKEIFKKKWKKNVATTCCVLKP